MTLRDLRLRLRAFFRPSRVERELDDERVFNIERETMKYVGEGSLCRGRARRASIQ